MTEQLIKEVTNMRAEELAHGSKDTRFVLALPYKKQGMRIARLIKNLGLPINYSTLLSIAIKRGLNSIEQELKNEEPCD